eukprot:CAMPEP_0204598334 /NCGR_PEP_ID=MMETSP0661-20131031/54260_1 /ASSEMBLY_ACC=CAM_ASM_000606 /TAXON_ID=109239 /ORGANISM="Alexandrium margalefi, Strain AMGDE01CS-322" /LENGTH=562 /DNA_ID=CAMNT_0051609037 /DNA_START=71 /DNA_END=1759 /DNA_ORIENTATION=-
MGRLAMLPGLLLPLLAAAAAAGAAASTPGSGVLEGLRAAFGEKEAKAIEARAGPMQEALRPIFASMPHNEHGKMGKAVVRYVLHRLFMQRGWSVRGLEPVGQAWSEGSPTEMLSEGVPQEVFSLFESRLGAGGLDLQEVALLAATFKNIVRAEMVERLRAAYRFHALQHGAALDEQAAGRVLDTLLASHVVGQNLSAMSEWEIHSMESRAAKEYGSWRQVQKLARETKLSLVGGGAVSFSGLKRVAEEVGERFGHSENGECIMRKQDLVAMEHRGSGRVRLSDFYKANLHDGKWHFGESTGYLRQLGALDESDPNDLRVVIPNYINTKSNCVDPSKYYSVCCLNECDALLGQLESSIGAPSATPSQIVPLVEALPSATTPANRTLPASLLRRLQEVAEGNAGRVPLHGRLFAQWMHHAYPRECPFPHISGTTSPVRVEDWAAEPGNEVVANREEMLQHIEAPKPHPRRRSSDAAEADGDGECAPWMDDEELLAPHAHTHAAVARESGTDDNHASWLWMAAGAVALLAAMGSGVVGLRPARAEKAACGRHSDAGLDQAVIYHV